MVKHLSNNGFNPKIDFTQKNVIKSDLAKVFGPKPIFKLTNLLIHANTKELKKFQ
jgi:hypothetical protein